jgi:D-xylose transport system substrate-binding protein
MDTETNEEVKSALAEPEAIYQDGVAKVIADGFQPKDDVCTGDFAKLCTKYGVK